MTQKFIILFMMSIVCLGTGACGKRGDLLPPEGYEAPK
jgi:hypothetical protein